VAYSFQPWRAIRAERLDVDFRAAGVVGSEGDPFRVGRKDAVGVGELVANQAEGWAGTGTVSICGQDPQIRGATLTRGLVQNQSAVAGPVGGELKRLTGASRRTAAGFRKALPVELRRGSLGARVGDA